MCVECTYLKLCYSLPKEWVIPEIRGTPPKEDMLILSLKFWNSQARVLTFKNRNSKQKKKN